jgi:hypothetical protein
MDLAKVPYPFSKADKIPDHAQGKQECDQHDAVEHRIRRFPGKKTDEREKYDDTKIKGKKRPTVSYVCPDHSNHG